jgi:hypothetical protein
MTLNDAQHTMTRTGLQLHLFLFALTTLFVNPRPTQAIGTSKGALLHPASATRSAPINNEDILRGVYVEDVLDLPIVQQPLDQPYYVSDRDGEVTQFSAVSQYGNIGLLAHNNLSGKYFLKLGIGQQVRLRYGSGRVEYFVVEQVLRFQALQPESVSSSFRNLDKEETLSAGEMFNRAYTGQRRLVFQTCIEAYGNASWGRLFVVAMPKE